MLNLLFVVLPHLGQLTASPWRAAGLPDIASFLFSKNKETDSGDDDEVSQSGGSEWCVRNFPESER
ncbi:hypothetical protein PS862_01192 [Pseudomonas fluorescens]|uniref:Uncharacterized protein n=1 Tax=Pseudomonas fluorescens TaxID=294 RepID=A0A5E6P102_PSEFL|nr:hypothetical protein [Pseudomonas fluorescens]VVM36132.1 hypothetical protein PS639_00046 [Pseudomonas fluorescens]VVO68261.1 hypothetical protein PS862_01192 [Pseudomonas fluorescens]